MENEIIKEFDENSASYECPQHIGEDCDCEYIKNTKQFILTKLKEERIKTLEEVKEITFLKFDLENYQRLTKIINDLINNLKN